MKNRVADVRAEAVRVRIEPNYDGAGSSPGDGAATRARGLMSQRLLNSKVIMAPIDIIPVVCLLELKLSKPHFTSTSFGNG